MKALKRLITWAIQAMIGGAMIVFTLFVLIEWVSGCGEAYVDAEGQVQVGECLHQTIYKHLSETN